MESEQFENKKLLEQYEHKIANAEQQLNSLTANTNNMNE